MTTPKSTPTKLYSKSVLTPTSKQKICIVCGKYYIKASDTRQLVKDGVLTKNGKLFEEIISVNLQSLCVKTNVICRYCVSRLDTIKSKPDVVHGFFKTTQTELLQKKSITVSKRCTPGSSTISPEKERKEFKRRSLFQESNVATIAGQAGKDDHKSDLERAKELCFSKIQDEMKFVCSQHSESILRKDDKDSLLRFSWDKLEQEFEKTAPTFLSFLRCCVSNPIQLVNKTKTPASIKPAMLYAGAKLVNTFNHHLNAVTKINSLIFKKCGLRKRGFARMAATNDCLSYQATLNMLDNFGENCDALLFEWKENVDRNIDEQFILASDNVDWEIKPRQMTKKVTTKSIHKTHAIAVQNRVSSLHLDASRPLRNITEVPLQFYLPNTSDNEEFARHLVPLVCRIWTDYFPQLSSFKKYNTAIEHSYTEELRAKSKPVFLGCYDIDQKVTDEVQEMLTDWQAQFVPHRQDVKVLAFADYLGFERQKAAQCQVRDARNPSDRLEGFISCLADFHTQAVWQSVIWDYLYDTLSGNEVGTLYNARQSLRARNVTADPHMNFYASEELLDKFTTAYIVAGGLQHFGMDNCESEAKTNKFCNEGAETEERYLKVQAASFIQSHVLNPAPTLEPVKLSCMFCKKPYKSKKSLRNHEMEHRSLLANHDGTGHQCLICGKVYVRETNLITHMRSHSPDVPEVNDYKYNYTRMTLTLLCIRMNMEDAIKRGDGERLILCYKYMYLYCKDTGHSKYALGLLETYAQANVLLSERDAHNLKWNRFVNTQGKRDTNFPIDLFIEHENRPLKTDVSTFRGEITNKTVQRVSRSMKVSEDVLLQYDKSTGVFQSSGKHTNVDSSEDVSDLARDIHQANLFTEIPGRYHRQFDKVPSNPLDSMNKADLHKWLKNTTIGPNGFSSKHYYKY